MKIVDAHHHLWSLARFPYPWLRPDAGPRPFGDHSPIKRDYLVADHASDLDVALAGSVHVQANTGADDPVAETAWVSEVTRHRGWPVAIVGAIAPDDPDPATTIARHAVHPAFRGVRIFAGHDDDPAWRQCDDPELLRSAAIARLAEALSRGGYSLDVVVHPRQLSHVGDLATAFPQLRIAINHLGQPRTSDFAAAAAWREGIARAAAAPNVSIKLSGLWTIDREWRPDVLSPFVRHVVSAFSAARCMYGSNLPIEKVMLPPHAQVPRLLEALGQPTGEEQDAILYRTAADFYRL